MTITSPRANTEITDTYLLSLTNMANGLEQIQQKSATGTLTLGTSLGDVPGMLATVTTQSTTAWLVVWASFDVSVTVAAGASTVIQCTISVDGTDITVPEALFPASAVARGTTTGLWVKQLSSAGSHSVQGRGLKAAAATATIEPSAVGHSNLVVLVIENY